MKEIRSQAIPAFEIEVPGDNGLEGTGVVVTPSITFRGATITVHLAISVPVIGSDSKTFTLTPSNRWQDRKSFFHAPSSFTVAIAVDTAKRRIRIHFHKSTLIKDIDYDRSFPYGGLRLPTDFHGAAPHRGPMTPKFDKAVSDGAPVGKPVSLKTDTDRRAAAQQCALLGDPHFLDRAAGALGSDANAAAGGSVLFALGLWGEAGLAVGFDGYLGFWVTDSGEGGFFSGPGVHYGSVVGVDAQAVLTVVAAANGRSAVENFESMHMIRAIGGEAVEGSIGVVGTIDPPNVTGLMFGLGLGGEAVPAGAYVGQMREVLFRF
jgi:hypothetical protein